MASTISAGTTSGTAIAIAGDTSGVLQLQTNGTTAALELDTSQNLKFNSGYGSVVTGYGCRAWVNFDGTGTVSIRASGNVSSITDNGAGDYTVNFSTAITDANYSFVAFPKTSSTAQSRVVFANGDNSNTTQSASSYRFYVTTLGGTPTDTDFVNCAVFR